MSNASYTLARYYDTRNELVNGDDEVIIEGYLRMINGGGKWPQDFKEVDVFINNPSELFDSHIPNFVVISNPTEACGSRTDGCNSGSWRIISREKVIKSTETEKVIGFKKILKFCKKTNPREYTRSWIMELYRLKSEWHQSQMVCKIRILFQAEINCLLSNHFLRLSSTASPVPAFADHLLPAYGFDEFAELRFLVLTHRRHLGSHTSPFSRLGNKILPNNSPLYPRPTGNRPEGGSYLERIMFYNEGDTWPSHVTNDVYKLHPLKLVDPQDEKFKECGVCIYANGTSTCGATDECEGGGFWRMLQCDKVVRSWALDITGFKRVYKFWENRKRTRSCVGDDEECWIIEEYRLTKKDRNKVVCVIKLTTNPLGFGIR